jgi:hypothetical protein
MVKISLIFLGVFSLRSAYKCSESSNTFPANQQAVAFYNVDNPYDTDHLPIGLRIQFDDKKKN